MLKPDPGYLPADIVLPPQKVSSSSIMETTPATTTTTTTNSRNRRLRTSKSPDNSGDDGKKRGRPRVDKQDESAADRRRTQIRMAQRAYRQRKESTLEELRKRVSELTNTLELMNKAFAECRDRLATSGLSELQMQGVHETAIQYEALMQVARNPAEEADVGIAQMIHQGTAESVTGSEPRKRASEPKNVSSWMDESVLTTTPKQRALDQVGLGYTMYMQDTGDLSSTLEYFPNFDQQSQALIATTKRSDPDLPDAFRAQIPDLVSMPASMGMPRTYSFQETTFARRLHRACLEQGYQLLLDPQRRPATYDRVFKLSLMGRDRVKLIAAIKSMLDRGPHESLDQPAPLIHVGGAGTHYPKRDQFGVLQPKKESWNLGVVGPQTLALLENAARDNLTTDMTVDIAGFEGEWFDPYDVEGYLNERGIYIDPSSSFAEAEIVVYDSPGSNYSRVSASESSPKTPNGVAFAPQEASRSLDAEQLASLSRDNAAPNDWNEFLIMDLPNIGFSDAGTGSWMNFLLPGEATKQHVPPQPPPNNLTTAMQEDIAMAGTTATTWGGSKSSEFLLGDGLSTNHNNNNRMNMFSEPTVGDVAERKKVVIIDVTKFVKVMTVSGVCLGRTPGFKRRDVDRALALSSFDAF